ncbi:hypothetical protein EVU96_09055 [Bacillus infantis]|uniref:hypothetical protein n=1 Tax=Bacillus infantis TaxID=324767 RepID=UPI00101D687F|nr:hypothetical protein [Bacillus infantis]RYI30553.1 hypothetical protein EVU96_09055 [Bacillus infantis]
MKPKSKDDYWCYIMVNGRQMESYCIDGMRREKHSAAQYLVDKYKMDSSEAYGFLNSIKHI